MDPLTATTFRYERMRAVAAGMLEAAGGTFLLLIAVTHFQAGPWAKAILAAGGSLGLLASPWVVTWVTRQGWAPSRAAAGLFIAGGVCFLVAALVPYLPIYVTGCALGMGLSTAPIPLLTHMFQETYPRQTRGQLFTRAVMIRIAVAAAFSQLGGWYLARYMDFFPVMILLFVTAFFFSGWCLRRCSTQPILMGRSSHPLQALRYVKEDSLFRHTLICWMLMGFGNLMMLPLRVEYLANPEHGLALSPQMVAVLTGVIPNLARLACSSLWGRLFDRMNFFVLRVTLNLGFAIGIFSFFTSDELPGLIVGAVVFGISVAGGDVAWSLWVTKMAPPGRVADYMSVHTFFTGIRGIAAPLLAFQLSSVVPLQQLVWLSAGLILLSCLMLLPEIFSNRLEQREPPVNEEISE